MKNYVQDGHTLSLNAPYDVASGGGLLVGALFAVAVSAATSGNAVQGATCGVYTLPKTNAQAWTLGAKVYWDDTNKVATTTASGNTLIGCAVAAAANPSTTGTVRLNGTV
ncbi:hypothetical protein TSH100_13850 [Azospirillum sp. TSH100]|uniref:DUF2190 family protein n=1 Tax=Azospirillum sp. TSH100 TaxID=652764 RepID=UPI000D60EFED|nr:capsid cement protein [Azospirillum sp. TSH100]PWC86054.1 hypothetical protein TSH100_13850 [Azospirillum sp. TSH100]QCG89371.1 DUF2190 family protein [Azospirillum sp. TSH100]